MTDSDYISDHRRLEERSRALHRAIVEKLRTNPALLQIALGNLTRWLQDPSRASPYFLQWQEIIERSSFADVLSMLVEDSERMNALRQSTPFCGILTPKERWKIYESYSVGTYYSSSGSNRE